MDSTPAPAPSGAPSGGLPEVVTATEPESPEAASLEPLRAVAAPLRLRRFTGLTLSPSRVGDPASARMFARPYRAVPERLQKWQNQGHLQRAEAPALYLHEYTASGMTVRGLVGALDVSRRVEPDQQPAIWPHEAIHRGQARELATRMAQMGLNPAPILLVHRGTAGLRQLISSIAATAPDLSFVDHAQQQNRVWAIRSDADVEAINAALAGSQALIADGHHRYAAYLRLQESQAADAARTSDGAPLDDSGLAMLVDQGDTPLFLGAIHRVLLGVRMRHLRSTLGEPERFTSMSKADALGALGPQTIVVTNGRHWASIRLSQPSGPDPAIAVEQVHREIIDRLRPRPRRINYHHSVEDTLDHLPSGAVAVLLPAPEFDQVQDLIRAGGLLPEKATSFQPKPSLGVLMRSLLAE
jgi:uncharacterized protein (DUF1015 family)